MAAQVPAITSESRQQDGKEKKHVCICLFRKNVLKSHTFMAYPAVTKVGECHLPAGQQKTQLKLGALLLRRKGGLEIKKQPAKPAMGVCT